MALYKVLETLRKIVQLCLTESDILLISWCSAYISSPDIDYNSNSRFSFQLSSELNLS